MESRSSSQDILEGGREIIKVSEAEGETVVCGSWRKRGMWVVSVVDMVDVNVVVTVALADSVSDWLVETVAVMVSDCVEVAGLETLRVGVRVCREVVVCTQLSATMMATHMMGIKF